MSKNALTVENLTKIYSNYRTKKQNKALSDLMGNELVSDFLGAVQSGSEDAIKESLKKVFTIVMRRSKFEAATSFCHKSRPGNVRGKHFTVSTNSRRASVYFIFHICTMFMMCFSYLVRLPRPLQPLPHLSPFRIILVAFHQQLPQ